MLRHGQLPFWNQYIFSGTPLMADFNAGAFYPLTGLFVVLPDRAAWIATEVLLFSAIAVGMYVFLRALKLSTAACVLAAATYAFAGPVLSQVNHVDMTEGFVAIPWMLLAVLHIVRDGRWRWTILLGIAYATVILAGAPEAMLDEALLIIAFAVMSAGLNRERWWRVVSRCGTGAALALSLAAIQWLPGLEAIRNSQRGSGVVAGAGSYPRNVHRPGAGSLHRRRVRAPRRGPVLQPVQPSRGRHLPRHLAGRRRDHLAEPALAEPDSAAGPSHVVRRGALRPASRLGLVHAPGASLQQPAALREPTLAEPQHDHGGHRGLRSFRGLARSYGGASFAGADDPVRPDHGADPGRSGGGVGRLGLGVAPHSRLAAGGRVPEPGHHQHRARGDRHRPRVLPRSGSAGLDPAASRERVVVSTRRRLRGRRPGFDGGDQPADPDGTERPDRRHHAGAEADGGEPGTWCTVHQLRPPDVLELPGEPPGHTRSQHHPGPSIGVRVRVDRQRELRVGDQYPRAERPRHQPAFIRERSAGSTCARS